MPVTDASAKDYRKALLKQGVAVELPSPVHMAEFCSTVMSSDVSQMTRVVIEHGRFSSSKKMKDGHVVERSFLMIPSSNEVVSGVVLDLMPLVSTGTKSGWSALEVLKTLRPSGYPEVKLPAERLVRDVQSGDYGDVPAAYAAFELTGMPSDDYVKVRSVEHDGSDWVVLLGVQVQGTDLYSWEAAEAVPVGEWQPDADLWHSYYGRRVLVDGTKRLLGRRVRFVPDKVKGGRRRKNRASEPRLGLPDDVGEVFVY
jgi:hypothetical protein